MTLKSLVDNAVMQIRESVSTPLTESETAAISKIIEDALIKTVKQSTKDWILVMDTDEIFEKKLLDSLQGFSKNNVNVKVWI